MKFNSRISFRSLKFFFGFFTEFSPQLIEEEKDKQFQFVLRRNVGRTFTMRRNFLEFFKKQEPTKPSTVSE